MHGWPIHVCSFIGSFGFSFDTGSLEINYSYIRGRWDTPVIQHLETELGGYKFMHLGLCSKPCLKRNKKEEMN